MRLPDFVYTSRFRNAVSYLLLAAILIGIYAGLDRATRKVEYIWRWNRMPRYFFTKELEEPKADFDGTVALRTAGGKVVITLAPAAAGRDAPRPAPSSPPWRWGLSGWSSRTARWPA